MGNPVGVSMGVTATGFTKERIEEIIRGERLADPSEFLYRDPSRFRAGELHDHYEQWENLVDDQPSPQQLQILRWIRTKSQFLSFSAHFRETSGGNLMIRLVLRHGNLEIILPVVPSLTL